PAHLHHVVSKRKWDDTEATLQEDELDRQQEQLETLEATIREHLGTGKFFLVAAALRQIEEDKLYSPEKSIYTYAKNKFSFSRRTTNTYLCSANVYESLVEDKSLPVPVNISHIRSLHKFTPDVRRHIWKEVCHSGQTITEEHVVAMTVKYETGVKFTDLSNEIYTSPEIITLARKVLSKPQFTLDPASCHFANNLHTPPLASHIFDESQNGLHQPWHGDVWLSPPLGSDHDGSRQSKWFLAADGKFLNREITSCMVLLQVDLGSIWFTRVQRWPHVYFSQRLTFSTPTGREKVCQDASHVLVYMGDKIESFCTIFGRVGAIPGFNTWAYKSNPVHSNSLNSLYPPPMFPPTLLELESSSSSSSSSESPHKLSLPYPPSSSSSSS
ncbi:hypothetical protein HK097_006065, partial [Rhizophlyctis rosea]